MESPLRQIVTNAGEEKDQLSLEEIYSQTPEISEDEVKRIMKGAEKGDIEELTAIAEALQTRSNAYAPFSEKLIQLAENLDFEEIVELVSKLA